MAVRFTSIVILRTRVVFKVQQTRLLSNRRMNFLLSSNSMDICLLFNSLFILVTKIVEKVSCQEKPEEDHVDFISSKQWIGDYLDLSLPDARVPMVAIERMNERLNTNGQKIEERTLRKVTNTCKRLIELFAMYNDRKEQLRKIRDIVARHDKDMAEEIDLDRFSVCSWYEGRIVLWR